MKIEYKRKEAAAIQGIEAAVSCPYIESSFLGLNMLFLSKIHTALNINETNPPTTMYCVPIADINNPPTAVPIVVSVFICKECRINCFSVLTNNKTMPCH